MTYSIFIVSNGDILKTSLDLYLKDLGTIHTVSFKELASFSTLLEPISETETILILDEPTQHHLNAAHEQSPHAMLLALIPGHLSLDVQHFPLKFLEKPFPPSLLKKMLQEEIKLEVLLIGEFKLYPSKRRLIHSQTQIIEYLTEKEVDILSFLYHHPRKLFSKEELLKQIWNYAPTMTTHTLETHIYRLRQKLTPSLLIHQDKGYGLWI